MPKLHKTTNLYKHFMDQTPPFITFYKRKPAGLEMRKSVLIHSQGQTPSKTNTIPTRARIDNSKSYSRRPIVGYFKCSKSKPQSQLYTLFLSYKNLRIENCNDYCQRKRERLPYKKGELGRRIEEGHRGIDSRRQKMKTKEL